MAKDRPNGESNGPEQLVTVTTSFLESLNARLAMLEHAERARMELAQNPHANVLDQEHARWKELTARPASVRTQEIADKKYGNTEPRFKVRLDSTTEDGKPGPNTSEHFPLEISANSDLEAKARYEQVMGIRKHDYEIRVEPAAALVA